MKGPHGRWKFKIGRWWQCPLCGKRVFTSGKVVCRACECGDKLIPERTVWMRLLEDDRHVK